MSAPGYAMPTLDPVQDFDWLAFGRRDTQGSGSKISWRDIGSYQEVGVNWTWGLEPGTFAVELAADHPMNDLIRQNDIDKRIYQFTAGWQGIPFSGRIMQRTQSGVPGREKFVYQGLCNKVWLQRGYGWVNNFFQPEVQFGLTGKQDIRFGHPDQVMKSYVTSVFTRLNKPVWAALPIRKPSGSGLPNLGDFNSIDDVLDLIFGHTDDLIALMSRFTRLDELFADPAKRLELGFSVDLWDNNGGTPPQVMNASGLGALQSIFDHNGDSFMDLSKLLNPINNGLYSLTPDRAGYVFNTHEKRDNRRTMFRTDSDGQIADYSMTVTAPDASRAIVGGKSPSIVNSLVEIGANLALAGIIAAISLIPGMGWIAGLTVGVGDLFDDVFFAYQVFADNDLENELGEDALPEVFADNTAAWTIDSYAVGKTALHEHGGKKSLEITAASGSPDGRGISFGADNGTSRRYRVGDILSFWDRGNVVEKHVAGVSVTSKRGQSAREALTLGTDQRAKGPWTKAIQGIQRLGATSRGFANST